MSRLSTGKKIYQMAKQLKRQRGGVTAAYVLDAVRCGYRHMASPENYFVRWGEVRLSDFRAVGYGRPGTEPGHDQGE